MTGMIDVLGASANRRPTLRVWQGSAGANVAADGRRGRRCRPDVTRSRSHLAFGRFLLLLHQVIRAGISFGANLDGPGLELGRISFARLPHVADDRLMMRLLIA